MESIGNFLNPVPTLEGTCKGLQARHREQAEILLALLRNSLYGETEDLEFLDIPRSK